MTHRSGPATGKSSWCLAKCGCGPLRAAGIATLLMACSGPVSHLGGSTEETAGVRIDNAEVPASRETTEIASLFADEVDDTELADIRGGQVAIGGLELTFGFVMETVIDGVLETQTIVNLTGLDGGVQTLANDSVSFVIEGTNGGWTEVIHLVGQGGVASTVVNTASDTIIEQTIALTIDVLNHTDFVRLVRSGSPLGAGIRLPNIMKDALIGAMAD